MMTIAEKQTLVKMLKEQIKVFRQTKSEYGNQKRFINKQVTALDSHIKEAFRTKEELEREIKAEEDANAMGHPLDNTSNSRI